MPRRRALLIAAAAGFAALANAADAPPEVIAALGPARLHGHGTLRYFGWRVYDARLWVGEGFDAAAWPRQRFVLELRYARTLEGRLIAERSLEEMRRQAQISNQQGERWLAAMQRLFPDVEAGDRLAAVHSPGAPTRVHANGALRGEVADDLFARLFFGIWLSAQTSQPALRRQLLGLGAE